MLAVSGSMRSGCGGHMGMAIRPQDSRSTWGCFDRKRPCIQHVSFVEGRDNIIVEYPGADPEAGVVSLWGNTW
jgi:hypothetical protein